MGTSNYRFGYMQENSGKKIISPSGIQKILEKADLWKKEKKK